ncbi:MAG: phenylacetate--CoA ligase family protein [Desulfomonile tiedjei]|uniref:Phenylacetate--CoA ligase family protein n=1 Tax=Desulfomonile tiedjei TaxID=2358 RepID=A0A9D6V1B8_9BACT|nr:phenylacetate--CoA ligase family protein [Desulfomonile tiedjei]
MRGYLKHLLQGAPPSLAQWAQLGYHLLPPAWRYGKAFRDAMSLLEASEQWDEKRLVEYQEKRLELIISQCYNHVPYYRQVFDEHGLTPRDIQGIGDLSKIPPLTKDTVRQRAKDLVATNVSFVELEAAHTSGSSGTPLHFYMDKTTRPVDRALALRKLLWLGYRKGDVMGFFKGLPLTNPNKFIRYFPGARELRISFHNSDEGRLSDMLDALNHYKPAFIDAWPSCLYILARWIEKTGRSVPPPRYILTASENLYPHIKDKIEKVFKAPVIDWYGQEESVAIALQCAYARGYHIQMEMGILELVPSGDGMAEIVGTCLHNMAMPFLRYKTGDLAIPGDNAPCPCGRKHPTLAKIVGREADFVLTPERNVISALILHYAFYDLPEVKEAQIVQEDLTNLTIKVVPWKRISEATRQAIIDGLRSRLESPKMNLVLQETEDIPRTKGGKRPFVISCLKLEDYL